MFPLPLYSVWPYTPAIPAFYWDAKSTEEIIKYLACEYDHITSYFDELTNAINNLGADVQAFETGIENRVSTMEQSLSTLLDNLEHVGDRMVIYDPTKGTYVDSKIAMRDMYRELAVRTRPPQLAISPFSTTLHHASPTRKPATHTRPYNRQKEDYGRHHTIQQTTVIHYRHGSGLARQLQSRHAAH